MSTPQDRRTPPRPPAYSRQPPPKPQAPDPVLQQRAWAAVLLALISLFGLVGAFVVVYGGNPDRSRDVDGVAIAIAVVAVWLATTARSRARRAGSARPRGATLAMVLGIIGLVLTVLMLPYFTSDAPQLSQYFHCMSGATTTSSQHACEQQLKNQVS
jgi:4-amino-4-deoxy-L-arabinose transferase-like glycosyltransferase